MKFSTSENNLKILSNVCTHRAALLCLDESNSSKIKCNYHGRVFNLEGQIIKHYGFEGVKNFPSVRDNLINIEEFNWNDDEVKDFKKLLTI